MRLTNITFWVLIAVTSWSLGFQKGAQEALNSAHESMNNRVVYLEKKFQVLNQLESQSKANTNSVATTVEAIGRVSERLYKTQEIVGAYLRFDGKEENEK